MPLPHPPTPPPTTHWHRSRPMTGSRPRAGTRSLRRRRPATRVCLQMRGSGSRNSAARSSMTQVGHWVGGWMGSGGGVGEGCPGGVTGEWGPPSPSSPPQASVASTIPGHEPRRPAGLTAGPCQPVPSRPCPPCLLRASFPIHPERQAAAPCPRHPDRLTPASPSPCPCCLSCSQGPGPPAPAAHPRGELEVPARAPLVGLLPG